jgi:N-acetylglucosamine-6-phosphate deacetylase
MPHGTLFHSGTIHAESGSYEGWLLARDGRVAALGKGSPPVGLDAERVDLRGHTLVPGLIDLHVHGALGHDATDATPDGLREMARFYARHGVTGFMATTVTAAPERIMTALETIAGVMEEGSGGAAILGAHVEGPFLDEGKRGAQDGVHIRRADPEEYRAFFGTRIVRLITVAPEYAENQELIRYAASHGAIASIGHTRASYEQVRRAVELGATQVCHVFNGMVPLHHREPGALGAALTSDELRCELIADGVHIHPAVLKLAVRAKGVERIVLITDAMRGAGMPDGTYNLGDVTVTVEEGIARTAEGALAGSTLTLERAVANIMAAADLSLDQALSMATVNPARALGLQGRKGSIAVGKDADLVVLDDDLQVQRTLVAGRTVYSGD